MSVSVMVCLCFCGLSVCLLPDCLLDCLLRTQWLPAKSRGAKDIALNPKP